jgi:hypothetical protein
MTLLAAVATAVAVWIPDIGDRTAVERAASLLEREVVRLSADAARTGHDRTMTLEGRGSALTLRTGDKATELDATLTAKWTATKEVGSTERQG